MAGDEQKIVPRRVNGALLQAHYDERSGKWGGWTLERDGERTGEIIDRVDYKYDSPGEVLDYLESHLGDVRYWREKFGIAR
jgi:hypothetical protein